MQRIRSFVDFRTSCAIFALLVCTTTSAPIVDVLPAPSRHRSAVALHPSRGRSLGLSAVPRRASLVEAALLGMSSSPRKEPRVVGRWAAGNGKVDQQGGWSFVQTGGAAHQPVTMGAEVLPLLDDTDRWLSFWYWRPLLFSVGFMMVVTEVAMPILDLAMPISLAREVLSVACAFDGLAVVAAFTYDPRAAGGRCFLVVAGWGCAFAMLMLVVVIALRCRKTPTNAPIMLLLTDVATLLRPALQLLSVGVVFGVGAKEAQLSLGLLVVFIAALVLLGALAFSGVVTDFLALVSIRLGAWCSEGDFLMIENELLQVDYMGWRCSVCVGRRCSVCVPNSMLQRARRVRHSMDDKRNVVDVDVRVCADSVSSEMAVSSAQNDEAVESAQKLLREMREEGFAFMGSDGKVYPNQCLTEECEVFVEDGRVVARIAFECKECPSGPPQSFESMRGWRVQVEWFSLELRRRSEQLAHAAV